MAECKNMYSFHCVSVIQVKFYITRVVQFVLLLLHYIPVWNIEFILHYIYLIYMGSNYLVDKGFTYKTYDQLIKCDTFT